MRLDRIRKLVNADACNNFVVFGDFKEPLGEDVVFVIGNKGVDVSDDLEDVKLILLDGLVGQEDVMEFQIEDVIAHDPHNLIGFHVMHVEDVEVIE